MWRRRKFYQKTFVCVEGEVILFCIMKVGKKNKGEVFIGDLGSRRSHFAVLISINDG